MSKAPISVDKNQGISLDKESGLSNLLVALGWKPRGTTGAPFDLDGSAIILGANDKLLYGDTDYFVFYGSLVRTTDNGQTTYRVQPRPGKNTGHGAAGMPCDPERVVMHTGDDMEGQEDGDAEQLILNLDRAPDDYRRIIFAVSIDKARLRKQHFGLVEDAYIRVEQEGGDEYRYDLSDKANNVTAKVFAELYRTEDGWDFRPLDIDYDGLGAIARKYGIPIA